MVCLERTGIVLHTLVPGATSAEKIQAVISLKWFELIGLRLVPSARLVRNPGTAPKLVLAFPLLLPFAVRLLLGIDKALYLHNLGK